MRAGNLEKALVTNFIKVLNFALRNMFNTSVGPSIDSFTVHLMEQHKIQPVGNVSQSSSSQTLEDTSWTKFRPKVCVVARFLLSFLEKILHYKSQLC